MRMLKPIACALSVVALSACTHTPEPEPTVVPAPPTPVEPPIYVGDSVVSHRVTFAFDSAELDDADKAILAYHAAYLQDHPEQRVNVQGNASSPGSHTYNYELGLERAQTVANALIEMGVAQAQLTVTSTGKQNAHEHNAQAVVLAY